MTDSRIYTNLKDLIRLEHKARGFNFLPRQPVHSILSGRHASRLRGRGLNFEEIRGYLPGDDIRTIDWKVTARTQKPHVRVYTEEQDRPALLVVDQRLPMFYGTREMMKSVTAAHLAALGAWRVFHAGDRVGAIVFNDTEIREIRPHRSRRRVMEILQAVLEQNHELKAETETRPNYEMLNQALERTLRLAKHDYLVAVISDFAGADEETKRLMLLMTQHNDVIAALVYDPSALSFPSGGRLVVSEGELQIELDLGEKKVYEPIAEHFKARVRDVAEFLRKMGVPVLPIQTEGDPVEQIRRQLGYVPKGI